jgi:hypothetical protein
LRRPFTGGVLVTWYARHDEHQYGFLNVKRNLRAIPPIAVSASRRVA